MCCSVLQSVAVCCRVLQSVVECCRVLQSVAVCCSVLQRVAVGHVSAGADTAYGVATKETYKIIGFFCRILSLL